MIYKIYKIFTPNQKNCQNILQIINFQSKNQPSTPSKYQIPSAKHPTVKSLFISSLPSTDTNTIWIPFSPKKIKLFFPFRSTKIFFLSHRNLCSNSPTCQGHVRASPAHTPPQFSYRELRIVCRRIYALFPTQTTPISMPSPSNCFFSMCVLLTFCLNETRTFFCLCVANSTTRLNVRDEEMIFLRGKKGLFYLLNCEHFLCVFSLCLKKEVFMAFWELCDGDDDLDGYLDAWVGNGMGLEIFLCTHL